MNEYNNENGRKKFFEKVKEKVVVTHNLSAAFKQIVIPKENVERLEFAVKEMQLPIGIIIEEALKASGIYDEIDEFKKDYVPVEKKSKRGRSSISSNTIDEKNS